MSCRIRWPEQLFLAALFLLAPEAWGQHGGPPGGGPPGGGPPMGGGPTGGNQSGFPHPPGGPPPGNATDSSGTVSTMRGGLQLAPPGRWWNDKSFSKSLKLKPEQQRRMDGIFDEGRSILLQRYEAYEQEQDRLETLTRAKTLDEAALMAEIERVGQARIALEKANTHMLLQIRAQMDPNQIQQLDSHR